MVKRTVSANMSRKCFACIYTIAVLSKMKSFALCISKTPSPIKAAKKSLFLWGIVLSYENIIPKSEFYQHNAR